MYYVYIMSSEDFVLYVGVTRDLRRRVYEHRNPVQDGAYTARHRIFNLVYLEYTENIAAAIAREKQIKAWRRSRKVALIAGVNPGWSDLASNWFDDASGSAPSLRSG